MSSAAKAHRVLRPAGHSLLMLELLWLFYGFGGLHVRSAPCLTSHLASVASRLTSFMTTSASRFSSFMTTGAPRLTPVHAGRSCSGWCWSGWCWSGW
jgi:hypothetical protein